MELEGQVAIVTGAGRGIGRATALELARLGADIVVAELDRANAERTAGEVQVLGRRASVVPTDVVRAHPERAFLFIRCDNDTTVFPHHGAEMKAASANAATELVTFSGCGHVKAFITYPSEWEARVVSFLEGQLGK